MVQRSHAVRKWSCRTEASTQAARPLLRPLGGQFESIGGSRGLKQDREGLTNVANSKGHALELSPEGPWYHPYFRARKMVRSVFWKDRSDCSIEDKLERRDYRQRRSPEGRLWQESRGKNYEDKPGR